MARRSAAADAPEQPDPAGSPHSVGRRRFLTYLVAAPVLTVASELVVDTATAGSASAAVPSLPAAEDILDVGAVLTLACAPTMSLIKLEVGKDGVARLDLPRTELGQGITTAVSMLIAEELDLPLKRVEVTIADARPELLFNQLTAGSATMRTFYDPVRAMAAGARGRLLAAAAQNWSVSVDRLHTMDGAVHGPGQRVASYESLSELAAGLSGASAPVAPKPRSQHRLVGKPTGRVDAVDIVTGRKKFTMDIMPTVAKPTMVRRPPTLRGNVKSVHNADQVRAMPGVMGVVPLEAGVAVVANTFEQARAAVNALDVSFTAGPLDGQDNRTIREQLKESLLPFAVPKLGASTVEAEFDWAPANHASLETEAVVADVRAESAEIWTGTQMPIIAQQRTALALNLPQHKVTVHAVSPGGGFGRRGYPDVILEAVYVSQAMSMPVRLMWHRTDDMRHSRMRPPTYQKIRATILAGQVISYEQRVSEPALTVAPGFGEILTDVATSLPSAAKTTVGMQAYSQTLFLLEVSSPYNFGVYDKTLSEVGNGLPTAAYRSVHCPMTRTSEEIVVDEVAAKLRKDPLAYRVECAKDARGRAVLRKVAELAQWGRTMPAGFAQGLGYHKESKTFTACVVELDGRNPQDPHVTKVTMVVDIGLAINPSGLEAQLQGCIGEAISLTLRAGVHIENGLPLEGSYHNYHWLRMRDYPKDSTIHIMPASDADIGGAGEVGITAASGAIANAYAAATGIKPRSFPIVFPVNFEPYPPGTLPAPEFS